jgi:hypothetical protein
MPPTTHSVKPKGVKMAIFQTSEELYATIGGLFERLRDEESEVFNSLSFAVAIEFRYSAPKATITVHKGNIYYGQTEGINPKIIFSMTGDVAHSFWMGKLANPDKAIKRTVRDRFSLLRIKGQLERDFAKLGKLGQQAYPGIYREFRDSQDAGPPR